MTKRFAGSLRNLLAVVLVSVVAACSMVGSVSVKPVAGGSYGTARCNSTLGAYNLPKRILQFSIMESGSVHTITAATAKAKSSGDDLTFCLDHLVNSFSDDRVIVKYYKSGDSVGDRAISTPFLEMIAANGEDKSVTIIRKVIKAVFEFLARDIGLGSQGANTVASFEVDPFNAEEMAAINRSLLQQKLGYCVFLEDYAFDVDAVSVDAYCNNPVHVSQRHPSRRLAAAQKQRFIAEKPVNGIFYRPRLPYKFYVMHKADPTGREPWVLHSIQSVKMENIAPIIAVGVDRAAFTDQRTALVFDEGTLNNICVGRASQAAAFVNIPLDIIYGFASELKRTAANAGSSEAVAASQQRLLATQEAHLDYYANGPAAGAVDGESRGLSLGRQETTQKLDALKVDPGSSGNIMSDFASICAGAQEPSIGGGQ